MEKLKFRDMLLGLVLTGYCDAEEVFLEVIKDDEYIESKSFPQIVVASLTNVYRFNDAVKLAKYLLNTEFSLQVLRVLEVHLVHHHTILSIVKMLINQGVLESNYNNSIDLRDVYIIKK